MLRFIAITVFVCLLWVPNAWARVVLQNDSIQAGDEIAFYLEMGGGESFMSIFDVPEDLPEYQICRVLLWIGPGGSNIFTVRIDEADDEGQPLDLVWQSDLDAYQVFGSVDRISSIDVAAQRIRSDVRRLRVRVRHVEGQNAPPGIASDTDGITEGHNMMSVLLRAGGWFRGFTEELEEDGSPPRPPGDWILRLELVDVNEACPGGVAPLPDAGAPNPPRDAGMPPPRDANVPIGPRDAGVPEDAMAPPPVPDMEAPELMDRGVRPDSEGDEVALELTRISPERGPADRNTEVVINGRGFPLDGQIFAEVGPERVLELEVLSGSTMTGLIPAGLEPGPHDLRLTRGDGQVAILPSAFTVLGEDLDLSSVTPDILSQNAPTELTILGQGFGDETSFSVAGVRVEDVTLESPGEARGTLFPSMPVGQYDLVARHGDEVARLEGAIEIRGATGPDGGVGSTGVPSGDGCAVNAIDGRKPSPWGVAALLLLVALRRRRASRN